MAARGRILGRVQENGKLFPPVPLTTQIEQNGAQARRFLEPPRFYVWPNRWRMNLDFFWGIRDRGRFLEPYSTCDW